MMKLFPDRELPVRIYLDTASWSLLSSGQCPSARKDLSALGEKGKAVFLVSSEHYVDSADKRSDFYKRAEFFRRFPGAREIAVSDLLTYSVLNILRHDAKYGSNVTALVPEPVIEISAITGDNWFLCKGMRLLLAMFPTQWQWTTRKMPRKKWIEAEKDLMGTLRGEEDAIFKLATKHTVPSPFAWPFFKSLSMIVTALSAISRQTGGTFHRKFYFDPFSYNYVFHEINKSKISDEHSITLYKSWKDKRTRCQLAPHAACRFAVIERCLINPEQCYSLRDEVDSLHALYAPSMHIFTCDKRNKPLLKEVIGWAELQTTVLRCDQLDEVAEVAHRLAESLPAQ
jgi:hypothetical protein